MGKYFGTDGIRGRANVEITSDLALRVGRAAGMTFRNGNDHHRVIIAKDTRESGYMIENALTAGFTAVGMDVLLTGPLPTPGLAYLTRSMRCEIGVMISASHNRYEDNGIKLFDPKGNKLSDEKELEVETLIDADVSKSLSSSGNLGRARRIDGAQDRYIEHVKRTVKDLNFEGIRVVIDCANGAGYTVGPEALWELGAEVIRIGVQPDGYNINRECGSTDPAALVKMVRERRADFGIALDGDADRVLLVDELGREINGDQILALFAKKWREDGRLSKPAVVGTVMSNLGVERFLSGMGVELIRAKVGDRYVVEEMRKRGVNVGGEQSGHFILSDYATTGDGIVTALQVLALLKQEGKRASEVCHLFTPVPQIIHNVQVKDKKMLERPDIASAIEEIRQKFSEHGRILVRPSGTEPKIRIMAESDNLDRNTAIVNEVEAVLNAANH